MRCDRQRAKEESTVGEASDPTTDARKQEEHKASRLEIRKMKRSE